MRQTGQGAERKGAEKPATRSVALQTKAAGDSQSVGQAAVGRAGAGRARAEGLALGVVGGRKGGNRATAKRSCGQVAGSGLLRGQALGPALARAAEGSQAGARRRRRRRAHTACSARVAGRRRRHCRRRRRGCSAPPLLYRKQTQGEGVRKGGPSRTRLVWESAGTAGVGGRHSKARVGQIMPAAGCVNSKAAGLRRPSRAGEKCGGRKHTV